MQNDIRTAIQKRLFEMQDEKLKLFQANLIPTAEKELIIGIRTQELRKYAKELLKDKDIFLFLSALPHKYFEENQLHGFIISEMKDYDEVIARLNSFLPYVDNWATCDQTSPKVFKKHRDKLICEIKRWLSSEETYTVRFGISMLMNHYLDDDFSCDYPEMVSQIRSDEYYVNMMIAWYFATALAKHYDETLPYLQNRRLDTWVHNKTIQKARESFRVSSEQKDYLKSLKK